MHWLTLGLFLREAAVEVADNISSKPLTLLLFLRQILGTPLCSDNNCPTCCVVVAICVTYLNNLELYCLALKVDHIGIQIHIL